jgi:prolipoprotein diacylglyceryl transferase
VLGSLLASIPSPSSGSIKIGPLELRAYGLMIALGVLAGGWLSGRRLVARRWGTKDQMTSILIWSVIAGAIGARLYHVVTEWGRYSDRLGEIPKLWEGGLGIPGGLIAGIPVGIWRAKRAGISARRIATAAAPAIPLAQAIGRWGNYWNQELFGRQTSLPWGLRIDDAHLPDGYASGTTFHPTFLYESLGNVMLCVALILIDRYRKPRPGRLMAMYLLGYAVLRFLMETLRIDPANEIAGLRVNTWMSMIVAVGATAWLVWDSRRDVPDEPLPGETGPDEPLPDETGPDETGAAPETKSGTETGVAPHQSESGPGAA